MRKPAIGPEETTHIVLKALAYIAQDENRLSRFLALTGVEADYVAPAASNPGVPGRRSGIPDDRRNDADRLCATEAIEAELPRLALRLIGGPATEYG